MSKDEGADSSSMTEALNGESLTKLLIRLNRENIEITNGEWARINRAVLLAIAWYAACHQPDTRKCDEAREAFGRALEGGDDA